MGHSRPKFSSTTGQSSSNGLQNEANLVDEANHGLCSVVQANSNLRKLPLVFSWSPPVLHLDFTGVRMRSTLCKRCALRALGSGPAPRVENENGAHNGTSRALRGSNLRKITFKLTRSKRWRVGQRVGNAPATPVAAQPTTGVARILRKLEQSSQIT